MSTRLIVVDDHSLVRQCIVTLLKTDESLEVVGEATNGFDALSLAQEVQPDAILMDLFLPGLDGVAATRLVKRDLPGVEVIILTASLDEEDVLEAIQAGARGYILKTSDTQSFLKQVHQVLTGGVALSNDIASKLVAGLVRNPQSLHSGSPNPMGSLTAREKDVLALIARGMTNKEISGELLVSENTARAHVRSLMQKLNMDNRTQLAVFGTREGLGAPLGDAFGEQKRWLSAAKAY